MARACNGALVLTSTSLPSRVNREQSSFSLSAINLTSPATSKLVLIQLPVPFTLISRITSLTVATQNNSNNQETILATITFSDRSVHTFQIRELFSDEDSNRHVVQSECGVLPEGVDVTSGLRIVSEGVLVFATMQGQLHCI
jgi:hypothetical protein